MTLVVAYPDGSQVYLGEQFLAVIGDGSTQAEWAWAIPATMSLGTARASWHVACTGGRNLDAYGDFQIVAG